MGAVPGKRLVRPDGVELDPEGFGLTDQVERVIYRFKVEELVLQRPKGAFADTILARALGLGPHVVQRGLGGDERTEAKRLERAAVVSDQGGRGQQLTGSLIDPTQVDQPVPEQLLGLGDGKLDGGDRIELVGGR